MTNCAAAWTPTSTNLIGISESKDLNFSKHCADGDDTRYHLA
ncbi:MAG: hypothetical protein U1F00_07530 [Rhodoferax sp.]